MELPAGKEQAFLGRHLLYHRDAPLAAPRPQLHVLYVHRRSDRPAVLHHSLRRVRHHEVQAPLRYQLPLAQEHHRVRQDVRRVLPVLRRALLRHLVAALHGRQVQVPRRALRLAPLLGRVLHHRRRGLLAALQRVR